MSIEIQRAPMRYHQYVALKGIQFPYYLEKSAIEFDNLMTIRNQVQILVEAGYITIYEDPSRISAYRIDLTEHGENCLRVWSTVAGLTDQPEEGAF